ncbi:MAG: DUF3108 domain-containing protein [Paludibacteraceae bacterium]|nr:DUF3108 domain-containing protein [Paludibacteraceae bacterium]
MKRLFILILAPLWYCALHAYTPQCPMSCTSLRDGEVLEYSAYFQLGAMRIERLYLKTETHDDIWQGDSVCTILAIGETQKTMLRFFGLQDSFYVHLRKADLLPDYYYEHDIERKYEGQKEYHYAYVGDTLTLQAYEYRNGAILDSVFAFTRSCPLDALSLVFRLRNFPFEEAKEGESYSFDFFNKGVCETLSITYQKPVTIRLRTGETYQCHKLVFDVSEGSLFSRENPVTIYLSTDPSHIVVHAEAKLKVGYAMVDLIGESTKKQPSDKIFIKK